KRPFVLASSEKRYTEEGFRPYLAPRVSIQAERSRPRKLHCTPKATAALLSSPLVSTFHSPVAPSPSLDPQQIASFLSSRSVRRYFIPPLRSHELLLSLQLKKIRKGEEDTAERERERVKPYAEI
ncbi:hypothetical protein MUK42_36456, partial [Musa troglodytarum]